MKKLFVAATVALSALLLAGQSKAFAQTRPMNFNDVDEKPVFQETVVVDSDFAKWVYAHIQYPQIARESGIQGRVTVSFTIDKDGTLKDAKVLRGVEPSLDKEALRVVSSSPKWKPARHKGEPVAVTYVFPVIFKLQ